MGLLTVSTLKIVLQDGATRLITAYLSLEDPEGSPRSTMECFFRDSEDDPGSHVVKAQGLWTKRKISKGTQGIGNSGDIVIGGHSGRHRYQG